MQKGWYRPKDYKHDKANKQARVRLVGATTVSNSATQHPDDITATVDTIMARYQNKTGLVLNTLNDVQDTYRYLPEEALCRISERVGVAVEDLRQMGDFFDYLSLAPTGRYIIEVCDGTCCHLLGAPRLMERFENVLGIRTGEVTEDGMLSLKAVNCVGACGIAPVVLSEDKVYGRVKAAEVSNIVVSIRELTKEWELASSDDMVVGIKGKDTYGL